jgi:predicted PhzF superfamily epimerase YddE/YHI9
MNSEVKQYRVFGANINGSITGGKRIAVIESADSSQYVALAMESGAPLTAFVAARDETAVTVRYFRKDGAEKPESDSGALVVAHHVSSGVGCRVVAPGGTLEVTSEDGAYWSAQGDHHVLPARLREDVWLEALQVSLAQRDSGLEVLCAGTLEKHNLIVPVWEDALNRLKPKFDLLTAHLLETGINGVILAAFGANRAHVHYRFFAPHRGIVEDNAGSYTLATLCGYLASLAVGGAYNLGGSQGYATGKPSSLRAKYIAASTTALAVSVGGAVQEVV